MDRHTDTCTLSHYKNVPSLRHMQIHTHTNTHSNAESSLYLNQMFKTELLELSLIRRVASLMFNPAS